MTTPAPRPGPRLAIGLAVALLAAGACKTEPVNVSCQNDRFQLPRPTDGPMLAYGIDVTRTQYHYLSTRPDTVEYNWDVSQVYYGMACLRFSSGDSVRIDSAGTFQLVLSGTNSAVMNRRVSNFQGTITDTIVGYVFRGCEGDGGTYRIQPDSSIRFTWRNGQQEGVFGSLARHLLRGDTIHTSLDVGTPADTIYGYWRLKWGRASCGEGY